jgi:hypothetical protein
MTSSVARASARGRLAGLTARRKPNDPELLAAQREYRAQALEDHIKSVADAAPALTVAQKEKLASLLRPASGTAVAV